MPLNCQLGDLAITVKCEIPENLGRIVRVVASNGVEPWSDYGMLHTWEVQTLSESETLTYVIKGRLSFKSKGPVPDAFLRPLRPPADEPAEEFAQPYPELQREMAD
jgi:hypothetical protein